MTWAVEVNEVRILACGRGADWWAAWRSRMEPAGRITVITPSVGGDLVYVACDSKDHAAQLRSHMTDVAGIPAAAVKVRPVAGRAS